MSDSEHWQKQKERDRKIIASLLQRIDRGEPIAVGDDIWRVAGCHIEDNAPGDGPSGFVVMVCDEQRRHVDFELSCCGFGVVVSDRK